ncbi:MAG TPA: hypothetical protein VFA20_20345 [Myxococcaceae bacterium]|nr:hypothetical protein [Myxococcaceae bacterium]
MKGRLAIAVCGALLLSRCGCVREPFALADVEVEANALTRCVVVVAMGADGGRRPSDRPLPVQPPGMKQVALFAGDLGSGLSIRAEGFSDPGCGAPMDEASPWTRVTLKTDKPDEVTLTIRPEGSCTDGMDGDLDGLVDCADPACAGAPECPSSDGGTDAGVFPYVPSNFAVNLIPTPDAGLLIDCDAGYDTTTTSGFFCGSPVPAAVTVTMQGGSQAVLLPVGPMTVTDAGRLTVVGNRPLIFAVVGNALIDGPLLAGAVLAQPGPGGSKPMCLGEGGAGTPGAGGGGGGGGGGSYGQQGGNGGRGGTSAPGAGGFAGGAFGNGALVPLLGGCSGGPGGESTPGGLRDGGGGGGALQLSASGVLRVSSAIAAPGGGGLGGDPANRCGGGAGGSGGAILLEALRLELSGAARLSANGGAGSEGGDGASAFKFGEDGHIDAPVPAKGGDSLTGVGSGGDGGVRDVPPTPGLDYPYTLGGGGGGGGAMGRIRLNSVQGCVLSGSPTLLYSPQPTSNLLGDAGCP